MNEKTLKLVEQLLPLPYASSLIEAGEVYLLIPDTDMVFRDEDWWLVSLVPNGDDLELEQVAINSGKVISESRFSLEGLREMIKSRESKVMHGTMPSKNLSDYRKIANAILLYRENFSKKIFAENELLECYWHRVWKKKDISLESKRYPVAASDNYGNLEIKIYQEESIELPGHINFDMLESEIALIKVKWNDREDAKRAIDLLTNESKWEDLEIQMALLLA